MHRREAAGRALPGVVVVVVRGVEEGPELDSHRQGGDTGCSRQERHYQRSVPSGALNAKDRKNLDFLPRVLGAAQDMGLGGVWTSHGQAGRAQVVRPGRGWGDLHTHWGLIHLHNL